MRKELEEFRETIVDENMVHELSKSGERTTHKNYSKRWWTTKILLESKYMTSRLLEFLDNNKDFTVAICLLEVIYNILFQFLV